MLAGREEVDSAVAAEGGGRTGGFWRCCSSESLAGLAGRVWRDPRCNAQGTLSFRHGAEGTGGKGCRRRLGGGVQLAARRSQQHGVRVLWGRGGVVRSSGGRGRTVKVRLMIQEAVLQLRLLLRPTTFIRPNNSQFFDAQHPHVMQM